MRKLLTPEIIAKHCLCIVAVILCLLPFHAFFTTLIGSTTGHLDLVRIWKELVIAALIIPATVLVSKDIRLRQFIRRNWLPRLMLIYVLLHLVLGACALHAGRVNANALIYGLLTNLRFFGLFAIVFVLSCHDDFLRRHWQKIVLVPAAIVIGFGLLQRLVLPYDFLRHFGYGPDTIPAYQTVDQKLSYRRIQSFLRGANPLGAYLILALTAAFTEKRRKIAGLLLGLGLVVLFFTYSRSAAIGAALALAVYSYLSITSSRVKSYLGLAVTGLVICLGLSVLVLRHNSVVQNTVFHTDNTSKSTESSNAGRAGALKSGLRDVIHEPLGRGPGTAGPASNRNNHPGRIAEDYYLQIGQEVGIIGALLFIGIVCLTAYYLWHNRQDELSRVLLASLVGITFVNLLSHAWADDTLGLLWWGFAGAALPPVLIPKTLQVEKSVILGSKRKDNGSKKQKTAKRN